MSEIDAVIAWVDGYDPLYQKQLKAFCSARGIEQDKAVEPTRIQQCNEIHYCLQALFKFAPWLRTIYIITNQQVPAAVKALQGTVLGQKIKMIDQTDLLRQHGAEFPIFNSISLEWLIWHIEGLSNQFLYLNDDFFIIKPVTPADFFRENRVVLRGEWKTQAASKWSYQFKKYLFVNAQPKTNPHRAWQEKSAALAGFHQRFYLLPHAPFPLIRDTFNQYMADKPVLFAENIRFPFRDPKQVSSIPLMTHLDLHQKRVEYDKRLRAIMVNGACHSFQKIKARLNHAHQDKQTAFVCMQSIDQAPEATREYMINWLEQQIETT